MSRSSVAIFTGPSSRSSILHRNLAPSDGHAANAVNTERIAALPMYDYPELAKAHDALWTAVADRLTSAGLREVPRHLTRGVSHLDIWRDPRLLLSQACEYPLANA